ncbi:uncharacterized protein LOC144746359 [Ciona intestinalis]
MTTSYNEQPQQTFFQRLRNTPKSLRRKLEKSADALISSNSSPNLKFTSTGDVEQENGTPEFNCRYLGERTVYTLKPDDCYEFAKQAAKDTDSKALRKVAVGLSTKEVEITFKPSSPIAKPKFKSGARFTPPTGSPKVHKKNLSAFPFRSSQESIPQTISPTTIFDRPASDLLSPSSGNIRRSYIYETNNNNGYIEEGDLDGLYRPRSRTFNGVINMHDEDQTLPVQKIPLHEIAYCVTVPDMPHLFVLTSRGKEGLLCRALMFQRKEKAQALKSALAQQFQLAYVEWQAKNARKQRRRSSLSVSPPPANKPNSQTTTAFKFENTNTHPNSPLDKRVHTPSLQEVHETNDDDVINDVDDFDDVMTQEEEAIHREFTRRASCLLNPEQLTVAT